MVAPVVRLRLQATHVAEVVTVMKSQVGLVSRFLANVIVVYSFYCQYCAKNP